MEPTLGHLIGAYILLTRAWFHTGDNELLKARADVLTEACYVYGDHVADFLWEAKDLVCHL